MKTLVVFLIVGCATLCDGQGIVQNSPGRLGTLSAPGPDAAEADPNQKKASVEGSVVSSGGDPLRKVTVTLRRADARGESGAYSAVSDGDGRFSIAQLPAGTYFVQLQRPGYMQMSRRMGAREPTMTLAAGQELKDQVFKMTAQGVISGKVTDEDGDPMQNVSVQILTSRYARGKKQIMPIQGAGSNDLGEYRIANLMPGKYYVAAQPQMSFVQTNPNNAAGDKPDLGYSAAYYPNAPDMAQAVMLDVKAGAEVHGIDFRLSKSPVYRIRGKVVDTLNTSLDQSQPGYGLRLMKAAPGYGFGGGAGSTMLHKDGTFALMGVAPGSYLLNATRMVNGTLTTGVQALEVGSSNLDNVVVTLREGQEVLGSMRLEGGDPSMSLKDTHAELEMVEFVPMNMPMNVSKDDNTFVLKNIAPVRYRVNLFGNPKGTYLKSVRLNGQEVADGILNFSAGTGGQLEIILSAKGAELAGTVQDADGNLMAGTLVVVAPDVEHRTRPELFRTAITGERGNFAVQGIAPGDYFVYAWRDLEDGAYMDPEVLSASESKATKVKLGESGTENVQLRVIASERNVP